MYHHQSMSIAGENDTEEQSIFNLQTSDGQGHRVKHKRLNFGKNPRTKRKAGSSKENDNVYEDESLYQATFESNENATEKNQNYDYDYNKYKTEYYQEESSQSNSNQSDYEEYSEEKQLTNPINMNKTVQSSTPSQKVSMENYCSVVLLLRIRVMECLVYGLQNENSDVTRRSGWVIVFWITIYTITALYLWCTRGWCCCCCPCACCHPYSVIQEAKEFLAQNPPGVAQLHSKRKVFYEPSENEKDCFTALEKEVFNF